MATVASSPPRWSIRRYKHTTLKKLISEVASWLEHTVVYFWEAHADGAAHSGCCWKAGRRLASAPCIISRILVIHDPGIISGCYSVDCVKIDRIPWPCWCQIPIHNQLSLTGLPATVLILVLAGCSTRSGVRDDRCHSRPHNKSTPESKTRCSLLLNHGQPKKVKLRHLTSV